ncbi:hypothetical protein BDQ17DRAFT_1362374, partial [Cyathus striatus]
MLRWMCFSRGFGFVLVDLAYLFVLPTPHPMFYVRDITLGHLLLYFVLVYAV